MTITAEQKAEWQEAREQADAAIARLNDLYATTARSYRVRLETYGLDLFPDLDEPPADDVADLGPIDGYRPSYTPGTKRLSIGSERAEREDEPASGDEDDECEDEQ